MPVNKACLNSVIKNTSGAAKYFSFLPPHGIRLANNETYTIFGNVLEAIAPGDRSGSRRRRSSFAAALDRGDLTIVSTPSPVVLDGSDSKVLVADGGSPAFDDPCWEESDSDANPVGA